VPRGTLDTAACGEVAEQTLLAPGGVWRSTGFASRIGCQNPGEHSLELGTPGLKDGRPLAFQTRMSVCDASLHSITVYILQPEAIPQSLPPPHLRPSAAKPNVPPQPQPGTHTARRNPRSRGLMPAKWNHDSSSQSSTTPCSSHRPRRPPGAACKKGKRQARSGLPAEASARPPGCSRRPVHKMSGTS